MDALAESHRPVVRLRDQWVVVDPELVRKARKRELGLLEPVDALAVALTGTAEVDGETVEAVPTGALAALRDRLTAGPASGRTAAGARRHPARLPAPRPRLAGPDDLARPRRLPRRRHGPRQDGHASSPSICTAARDRRRPWWSAPPPCSATGSARSTASRRACPSTASTAPGRTLGRRRRRLRPHHLRHDAQQRAANWPRTPGAWSSPTRPSTSRTRSRPRPRRCARIPAPARVALTGTPVENNLSELWALLDWTTRACSARSRPSAPVTPASSRTCRTPSGRHQEAKHRGRGAPLPAGPPVPAAQEEVRPRHRPRAAAQDGDRPSRRPHPGTGLPLRGGGPRNDGSHRGRRGHRPARPGHEAAHRPQADLQPPRAVSEGGRRPG